MQQTHLTVQGVTLSSMNVWVGDSFLTKITEEGRVIEGKEKNTEGDREPERKRGKNNMSGLVVCGCTTYKTWQ